MVVPCCRDRTCEVPGGSLFCPTRRSGATPRSPFRAVAMPLAVGKAQVGFLSLGLGLVLLDPNRIRTPLFSFHSFFFAFDSETLDLHPRLTNC